MSNHPEIAQANWKLKHQADFALLDTPQEQIEFLKDLLLKNKENVIEAEKLPQLIPSDLQLSDQIKDEFAPHKPTDKEWKKRWDEVNEEYFPVRLNQERLSILRAEQELIIGRLKTARKRLEVLPTYETHEVKKIPSTSSEEKISPKIVESKHDGLDILLRDIAEKEPDLSGGEVWNLLCREMLRKTCKYDHDRILLQKSSDDSNTLIWKSGRGKSNQTRLTKEYLERNKWPAAKKWAKENHTIPS